MNIENRRLLTNEQQLSLREWEALFKLPAWQWLVRDAIEQRDAIRDYLVLSAETEADLHRARAQIGVLTRLANLEAIKEAEYNQLTESLELTSDELRESAGANS